MSARLSFRRENPGYTKHNMWARLLFVSSVVLINAASVPAQQDPADLLLRVQRKVAASLDRLPRFMCTETVDRSRYAAHFTVSGTFASCDESPHQHTMQLATSDRLRLDVAQGANREMYSWVGENRFDDRNLTDMVRDGAISDGNFTGYLSIIFRSDSFRSDNATFTYNGETTQNGRTLSEFGFDVPRERSHYVFSDGQHRVVTGYGGTFLVDPGSADLIQISFRSSRLAPETLACYASTTLVYTRFNLQGVDILLPESSFFRVVNADGGTSENHTVLSNCHEFLGESTLSFGPPPDAAVSQGTHNGQGSQTLLIPPGLPFRVALTQGIDTATAGTGDRVKGKLAAPIREGSKVLVPAGAAVAARIVHFQQSYGKDASVTLALLLETVDAGGLSLPLTAYPGRKPFPKPEPGTLQPPVNLGTLRSLQNRSFELVFRTGRRPGLVGRGFEMDWVTAVPPVEVPTLTLTR